MIQKKVISQTIPTFYTTADTKNDLENNSCENFSILTSKAVPLASSQTSSSTATKTIATKMEPSIKSVNYFGYQFNSNRNKVNDSSLSSINKSSHENNQSPSQMYRKSQQSSFQKYVIEKQVRQHFNYRNPDDPNTKLMISKILNGDIEREISSKNIEVSSGMNKMVNIKFLLVF